MTEKEERVAHETAWRREITLRKIRNADTRSMREYWRARLQEEDDFYERVYGIYPPGRRRSMSELEEIGGQQ